MQKRSVETVRDRRKSTKKEDTCSYTYHGENSSFKRKHQPVEVRSERGRETEFHAASCLSWFLFCLAVDRIICH